jgi:CubicO group peptidase (beta-lactamase class C family)
MAARLVDEKRIDWDDKVQKYLPWFKLYDPEVTRMVSLRDLLGMRTGLSSSEYSYRRSSPSREEQVRRMRYLKPAEEFRDAYIYSTDNYAALGLVEATVAGQPWEALAQQEFWGPLGMTRTNASYLQTRKSDNFAWPHVRPDQDSIPIEFFYEDYAALPAGGINSSARDMGAWLQFQLDDGAFAGKQLISADALEETHRPQMPQRVRGGKDSLQRVLGGEPLLAHESYAMGWETRDYRGTRIVTHAGAIDGFRCSMTLVPSKKLGMVFLTNSDDIFLPIAVSQAVVDKALGTGGVDWIEAFARYKSRTEKAQAADAAAHTPKKVPDQPPTRPLADFTGAYTDMESGYGAATLTLVKGKLVMAAGRMTYDFEPWAGDVFRVTENSPSGRYGQHPFFATFRKDTNGAINTIETTTGAQFERASAGTSVGP